MTQHAPLGPECLPMHEPIGFMWQWLDDGTRTLSWSPTKSPAIFDLPLFATRPLQGRGRGMFDDDNHNPNERAPMNITARTCANCAQFNSEPWKDHPVCWSGATFTERAGTPSELTRDPTGKRPRHGGRKAPADLNSIRAGTH